MVDRKKLGVLGGMGPQATQLFYQRVLHFTAANSDQEHIPTLILSDTQMPDRTAAILSGNTEPVYNRLLDDARLLEDWGAGALAIPCNTSHAFITRLQQELHVPIINMIAETAIALKQRQAKRVGILGTDGTLHTGIYRAACEAMEIEVVELPREIQHLVMHMIYEEIKAGGMGSDQTFSAIDTALRGQACDCAVLACTELSVYKNWRGLPNFYLDAMDVLAQQSVLACGYSLHSA